MDPAHSEATRTHLQEFGQKLAEHLQGSFALGPDKTREQALAGLMYKGRDVTPGLEEDSIYQIVDFRRGCLLVEDNHALIRARKKLRDITDHDQAIFLEVRDLYSRPPTTPIRGIYVIAMMPNEEVVEIQVHTRAYWENMIKTHAAYETHRDFKAQSTLPIRDYNLAYLHWVKGHDYTPLATEWTDEARGLSRRARATRRHSVEQAAHASGAFRLELKDKNYQGDCSFPLRPAVVAGQSGYMIADDYLDAFVKKEYPWRDPSWNTAQGKREPEPE